MIGEEKPVWRMNTGNNPGEYTAVMFLDEEVFEITDCDRDFFNTEGVWDLPDEDFDFESEWFLIAYQTTQTRKAKYR